MLKGPLNKDLTENTCDFIILLFIIYLFFFFCPINKHISGYWFPTEIHFFLWYLKHNIISIWYLFVVQKNRILGVSNNNFYTLIQNTSLHVLVSWVVQMLAPFLHACTCIGSCPYPFTFWEVLFWPSCSRFCSILFVLFLFTISFLKPWLGFIHCGVLGIVIS